MKHVFEGMLKDDSEGPSLIDLIQEQLGLRFSAEPHSVAVLTVGSADRTPTANWSGHTNATRLRNHE
jgi:uncharacterized protein (TIGR03435 family)